ncbi:cell surface heme-binding protein Shp [Peptoanaerobacter stomatis]|uniref:Cell surface heme-binding protein Shp n=1 Tax=Peptoanaerobacter stomatis TaxID=796937 RepID=J5U5J6_9FIRM|nr:heme-binding Shp domain-containing protein [Peptoanaerobacter stomatis]EJU19969.1 cell surface heme-binding protein Shp [Peptoanaerobacter stomatis]NWO26110.1 cell wall anchor protein [Peptostreptococcaceae bacterium oral taxon 081]
MLKKILSSIIALSFIFTIFVSDINAQDLGNKVYSIKNTAQYENPITKELEDLKIKEGQPKYKSKKAIGDGMSRSILGKYALLDNTGKTKSLTIKIGLTDVSKDYKISVKNVKDDKYKEVKFKVVKEDKKKKTKDIKFEVPTNEAYIKISAYVEPMGRDITFFAQMSSKDAKEGAKEFNSQKMTTKAPSTNEE